MSSYIRVVHVDVDSTVIHQLLAGHRVVGSANDDILKEKKCTGQPN